MAVDSKQLQGIQRGAGVIGHHPHRNSERMKFLILLLFLSVFQFSYGQSNRLDSTKLSHIKKVIELFKRGNVNSISGVVEYPLRRDYPIPSVKNEMEFKLRFNEIFDQSLIDRLANSKMDEWSDMGWKGIMFDNGVIWLNSNEGKIIAVNEQSNFEKKQIKNLLKKDKVQLHSSLQKFQSPTYKLRTKNYLIRIDKLADYKYRFASWKIGGEEWQKPDIVLNNGQIEYQGSAGNEIFTFINENYTYKIHRNILSFVASSDFTLKVTKNGMLILSEDGILIED